MNSGFSKSACSCGRIHVYSCVMNGLWGIRKLSDYMKDQNLFTYKRIHVDMNSWWTYRMVMENAINSPYSRLSIQIHGNSGVGRHMLGTPVRVWQDLFFSHCSALIIMGVCAPTDSHPLDSLCWQLRLFNVWPCPRSPKVKSNRLAIVTVCRILSTVRNAAKVALTRFSDLPPSNTDQIVEKIWWEKFICHKIIIANLVQ